MKKILLADALPPAGHYSPAVAVNGFVFISGQLPIDPISGEKIEEGIEAQTEKVLENLEKIIHSAGGTLEDIVKVTVYISDIKLWDQVDDLYSEFFGEHKPARAIVPTNELHYGFKIEMEAIAYIGN